MRAEAGIADLDVGDEAGQIDEARHFKAVRPAARFRAANPHAVWPDLLEFDSGVVDDNVRRDVSCGVMHLIKKLKGARQHVDNARLAIEQEDLGRSVRSYGRERITRLA